MSPRQREPLYPEPRRSPRYHATTVGFRSGQIEASVVNLSDRGVGIQTSDTPRMGAPMNFELEDDRTAARMEGEVRWCSLAGTTQKEGGDILPVYRAGIRFTNGNPVNFLRILRSVGLGRPSGTA